MNLPQTTHFFGPFCSTHCFNSLSSSRDHLPFLILIFFDFSPFLFELIFISDELFEEFKDSFIEFNDSLEEFNEI